MRNHPLAASAATLDVAAAAHSVGPSNGATRRTIFGGAAGLAALAAATLPQAQASKTVAREFIDTIESLNEGGGRAAIHALAAGMKPEWCYCIIRDFEGSWKDDSPALVFKKPDGTGCTFRPSGVVAQPS